MARVSILPLTAPVVTAPAGIWFEAVELVGFDVSGPKPGQTYDPAFHEITYVWTVKQQPLPNFSAPINMIPGWNNPNRAHGKQVALFFPKPGRYEVTLRARDRSGNEGVAEYAVNVSDPDQVYSGRRTICVSFNRSESWAKARPGCQRIADAYSLSAALEQAERPVRVLFRRGQVFPIEMMKIQDQQLGHVDAWGDGSLPILQPIPGFTKPLFRFLKRARLAQFTIANLGFRGGWDTTTETGLSTSSPFTWTASPTPCHYTIWGCWFDGFDHIDVEVKKGLSSTILVGNSTVTNWRNYGFLMRSGNARFALSGMCIAQHVDALHGGRKTGGMSNNHGPVRIPDCAKVYIGTSDIFSRSGWSGLSGELADQPCLRLNTSGIRDRTFNIERVVCEGGAHVINLEGANEGVQENPGNYLIDKALLVGTAKTIGPFVAVDFGGLTVRNLIGILPDTPRRHGNRWQGAMRTRMTNPGPGNAEEPFAFYSSTILNLLSNQNDHGKPWVLHMGGEAFSNATIENVLLHDGPRQRSGIDLSRSIPGVRPRYKGIRYNFKNQAGKLLHAVAPGADLVLPYDEIFEALPGGEEQRATTQSYWKKNEATDRWHMLWIKGVRNTMLSAFGDFRVQFESVGVVLTNTSGKGWEAGARFELRLDRTSRLQPMDRRFASPEALPLPLPSIQNHRAQGGMLAHDDFFGRSRGATPTQGAVEPI